jgi:hypothetical protein
VAVVDNLPAGLLVATPNGLTNTCGGVATAVAGSGSVSLTGGTLLVSSSCTLAVTVTATTYGLKNNVTGPVFSTEGGVGGAASASIDAGIPPAFTSPVQTTITAGGSAYFQITTTGTPIPVITMTGSLPAGVIFVDNGDGTAKLVGAPVASSAGTYNLVFTATNGVGAPVTQDFALVVVANAEAQIPTLGTFGLAGLGLLLALAGTTIISRGLTLGRG